MKPRGRPVKEQDNWTESEIDYITSEACLRYQGALKLEDRAAELSVLFMKKMDAKTLRQIYCAKNINQRIIRKRLGGPKAGSAQEQ